MVLSKNRANLLAAAVLVCACISPITSSGEIKLPLLGDTTSGVVSLQQEHELGRAWLQMFRSRVATLNDAQLKDYLEQLVKRLASHSELNDRRLELITINNPTINAFAVPGGLIAF